MEFLNNCSIIDNILQKGVENITKSDFDILSYHIQFTLSKIIDMANSKIEFDFTIRLSADDKFLASNGYIGKTIINNVSIDRLFNILFRELRNEIIY